MDVAHVEEPHLPLVHRRKRMGDERIQAWLIDLHVEHATASSRHGHLLDIVQRIPRPHVTERICAC